jgi:hypothetical protein
MNHIALLMSVLLLAPVGNMANAAPAHVNQDRAAFNEAALSEELMIEYEKTLGTQGCTVFPPKLSFMVVGPRFVLGSVDGSQKCFGDITYQITTQKAWKHTLHGYAPIALTSLIASNTTNRPMMLSELPGYARKLKKVVSPSCGASWATEKSKTEPATFIFKKRGVIAIPQTIKMHPCFPGVFYAYRELKNYMAPELSDALRK